MTRRLMKDSLLWGIVLWLVGYMLGIVLFPLVPSTLIGWVIMPFGVAITLWVLFRKVKLQTLPDYVILGVVWMVIAILADYFLLVKVFHPADGYYKFDVYLYYLLTFLLPILVGRKKYLH